MADKWPKANELRGMPDADIRVQLDKLTKELWHARQKTAEGAQQQTHRFSAIRRQIARIHTVLNAPRQSAAKAS
jgi:ribosomal protein L29